MVDAGDPNAINENIGIEIPDADAQKLADQVAKIKQASSDFNESATNYADSLNRLAQTPPPPGADEKTKQQWEMLANRVKRYGNEISGLRGSVTGLNAIDAGWQGLVKTQEAAANASKKTASLFAASAEDLKKVLGSGSAVVGLLAIREGLEGIDKRVKVMSELEEKLAKVHKAAMQASMGLGRGFREAQGSVSDVEKAFGATMVTTRSLREDVERVTSALKVGFTAREMFQGMEGLRDSFNKTQSAMNLVNTAILVGAARDIDGAKAANMLTKAHLELGESVESASEIFGYIDQAAEDADIQFEKVADSIVGAANDMKLWGGTVASVTPTFKAFSAALGEGRKGLVEPMFDKYMKGLQGMQFEMRALIGITAGVGGAAAPGGALGAGLRMEALMEQGPEGMAEFSENLIGTLKELTGGQMLTREQALENPELINQFKIQRQVLGDMIGANEMEANKMLEILQSIDENGIDSVENAKERMNEIVQNGENVQKATTNDLKNATLQVDASINSQGEAIVNALNATIKRTGARQVITAAQRAATGMATGRIGGIQGIREFMKGLGAEDMFKTISQKVAGLTGQKVATKEEQGAVKTGQQAGITAVNRLMGELARKRDATIAGGPGGFEDMRNRAGTITRMATGQEIQTRFVKKDIQGVIQGISDEIKNLKQVAKEEGGLTQAGAAKLETLKTARRQMTQMARQKTINLAELGEVKEQETFKLPPTIRRRTPRAPTPTDVLPDDLFSPIKPEFQKQVKGVSEQLQKAFGKRRPDLGADERLEELMARGEDLKKTPNRIRRMTLPPLRLPVREAQQAARETREEIRAPQQQAAPETVEKKIALKIIPDRQTVTIEVDERKMREIARDETDGILER